jgi:hypothetical protein
MDDNVTDETDAPVRPTKPSNAPSWAMLGFVFGALFIWALPHHEAPPAPAVTVLAATPAPVSASFRPSRLTLIEDVMAEWSRYAVWQNDLTEVALWNSEKKSFADCYEVMRSGENFYVRSIPRLTRPPLTHGVPAESPLQFTEPQAQRDEWLRERNQLTFRAISEAAQQNIPAIGAKPAPVDEKK